MSEVEGTRIVVVEMVSQHWLTDAEVDRTEWRHWLRLSIPPRVLTDVAFLYIQGGGNNSEVPQDADPGMVAIANATGSVVAELAMVPNQPLSFDGDGVPRWEDDLIAYNWAKSLTGDGPKRLVLDAMTKSAVRAMDTVSAVMATEAGGERHVERFVVSGGWPEPTSRIRPWACGTTFWRCLPMGLAAHPRSMQWGRTRSL